MVGETKRQTVARIIRDLREKVIDASNELKVVLAQNLTITTDGAVQPAEASKRKQDEKTDASLKVSDPPAAKARATARGKKQTRDSEPASSTQVPLEFDDSDNCSGTKEEIEEDVFMAAYDALNASAAQPVASHDMTTADNSTARREDTVDQPTSDEQPVASRDMTTADSFNVAC